MPHPRPMLAGTRWPLLRSFLFSSPTPCATLVISGCRFTSHMMVQERCVLALPSCGERASNVYFWGLTHHCVQVPFSVENTSSLVCFSCCLEPNVAIVTAIEHGSVSSKSVSIPGTSLSPALARRYGANASAFTCTRLSWLGAWRDRPSPGKVEESLLYSRKRFIWSGSGVIVLMLWHYMRKTVLIVGQRYICLCIYMYM